MLNIHYFLRYAAQDFFKVRFDTKISSTPNNNLPFDKL